MKDKQANFIRLAEQRTNKVLRALRVLEHCSNTAAYEYSDAQVEAIFERIEKEVEATKARFERTGSVFQLK